MTPVTFAKRLVPDTLKRLYHEFRWPTWSVRLLPGSSRHYGPPRRWIRAEEYCRRFGGKIQEVLPPINLPPLRVHELNAVPPRFLQAWRADLPAASVLTVRDVRVYWPNGWIVGAGDHYLADCSFWGNPPPSAAPEDHYILRRMRAPRLQHLPGKSLSLASDFAIGGFGHFLHDSVTRLRLVESAGLALEHFDWILWPHPDTPSTRAIIATTGLDPAKIIWRNTAVDYACDELTATTFPGRPGHIAPVYAQYLRQRFGAPIPPGRHRIHLSRRGFRRNFRDYPRIQKILQRHGFEDCEAHADPATFAKCASATHLVAIEGANFFNAFASPAGTRVLLILPDCGPTTPYTLTMAAALGFETYLYAARSLDQPQVDPGIADIQVDPDDFARALRIFTQT